MQSEQHARLLRAFLLRKAKRLHQESHSRAPCATGNHPSLRKGRHPASVVMGSATGFAECPRPPASLRLLFMRRVRIGGDDARAGHGGRGGDGHGEGGGEERQADDSRGRKSRVVFVVCTELNCFMKEKYCNKNKRKNKGQSFAFREFIFVKAAAHGEALLSLRGRASCSRPWLSRHRVPACTRWGNTPLACFPGQGSQPPSCGRARRTAVDTRTAAVSTQTPRSVFGPKTGGTHSMACLGFGGSRALCTLLLHRL